MLRTNRSVDRRGTKARHLGGRSSLAVILEIMAGVLIFPWTALSVHEISRNGAPSVISFRSNILISSEIPKKTTVSSVKHHRGVRTSVPFFKEVLPREVGSSCVSGGYNLEFAAIAFTAITYNRLREQRKFRHKCLSHICTQNNRHARPASCRDHSPRRRSQTNSYVESSSTSQRRTSSARIGRNRLDSAEAKEPPPW